MIRILVLLGFVLMTTSLFAADATATGASLAFTSNDPVIKNALVQIDGGNFSLAEKMIAATQPSSDPTVTRAREETLDLIQRMRNEFSLNEADLLAKIQRRIPDATARDVIHWREAGDLQYKIVDNHLMYFNREPTNLFLFSVDAKKRLPEKKEGSWKLTDHLATIVKEAEATGKDQVVPVAHRVEYTLTVPPSAAGMKKGAAVRIWLPFPQEYRQQKDVKLISASLSNPYIAPSAVDGDPVQHAQRTVYFEQRVDDPAKPIIAKIKFEYTSYAYYPKLDEAKVAPLPADWNGAYLAERLPHIKFAPAIVDQTKQIVGDETNPLIKARKIFHWVSANIPWNAEHEYCVLPSLSEWGFTRRRGDCGVQNTVFTTMCRIAGIPARWQSGWETKLSNSSMHDWAEIYIAPWGWLPADASYGVQESDDPKIRDFYLGHQDSYRMIFNLDYGRELDPPKQSLRSEPADFQRGEVEIDGKNLYFDQWDYNIQVWCDGREI